MYCRPSSGVEGASQSMSTPSKAWVSHSLRAVVAKLVRAGGDAVAVAKAEPCAGLPPPMERMVRRLGCW